MVLAEQAWGDVLSVPTALMPLGAVLLAMRQCPHPISISGDFRESLQFCNFSDFWKGNNAVKQRSDPCAADRRRDIAREERGPAPMSADRGR